MNISTTSLNEWRFEQKKRLEWWCSGINECYSTIKII